MAFQDLQNLDDLFVFDDLFGTVFYGIDEIIAYISQFFTLKTGDLLYTGTPAGVGPVQIGDHLDGWLEDRKVLDLNCK